MKRLSVLLVVIIFSNILLIGQNNNKLLIAVQDEYNSNSSLSADFVLSLNKSGAKTGKKSAQSGKIFLGTENKLRVEMKGALVVCDGSTFWNFKKNENKVIINNFDPNDPSSFSIKTILNEYPKKCTVEEENNTIILTPKSDSELDFTKAEIWIDKRNLIQKIWIEYPSMGNFEISLSNYNLDQNIPQSEFTFTPPEGSKIIDLR